MNLAPQVTRAPLGSDLAEIVPHAEGQALLVASGRRRLLRFQYDISRWMPQTDDDLIIEGAGQKSRGRQHLAALPCPCLFIDFSEEAVDRRAFRG